ncbi:hypothetical protein PIB30_012914 [Stylosanthes scabra]|uniref:Uncharacterized protein n=1 Tax=Stylosanthes scabra TaxID=79078 RepID=A0ABU6X613_9FABA|nr:hypothetical protein [Stylosanthes scabra]
MVPVFHPIVQRERQSEGFHCIVITTGPSSGGTDDLKVLDVLDGVFTRSATEFRQKVYQSGLVFKAGFSSGNWLGWLSKAGLAPPNCLRVSRSAIVETIKNKQIFRFPGNGAKNVTHPLGAGTFVRCSSESPLSIAESIWNVLKEVSQGATKIPSCTRVVLLRNGKGKSVFDWGWLQWSLFESSSQVESILKQLKEVESSK